MYNAYTGVLFAALFAAFEPVYVRGLAGVRSSHEKRVCSTSSMKGVTL